MSHAYAVQLADRDTQSKTLMGNQITVSDCSPMTIKLQTLEFFLL